MHMFCSLFSTSKLIDLSLDFDETHHTFREIRRQEGIDEYTFIIDLFCNTTVKLNTKESHKLNWKEGIALFYVRSFCVTLKAVRDSHSFNNESSLC